MAVLSIRRSSEAVALQPPHPIAAVPGRVRRSKALRNFFGFYLPATVIAVVMVFPFLWMVSVALRPEPEVYAYPPHLIPHSVAWDNFMRIWTDPRMKMGLMFWNTLVYATVRTFLQLLLSSMAAFVLARYRFPGRNIIFLLVLATVTIPHEVLVIPLFIMIKQMPFAGGNDWLGHGGTGWLDSFKGLILPGIVSGYSIFFLRQSLLHMPDDIEDAARIDGASEFSVYWRICLPMALPGLTALGVFSFQFAWSDFMWPLIITRTDHIKTIQFGLAVLQSADGTQWSLLMAGAVIATLPLIALFLLLQRFIASGINFGVGR
jgi:multiple sugar transport system permease protein